MTMGKNNELQEAVKFTLENGNKELLKLNSIGEELIIISTYTVGEFIHTVMETKRMEATRKILSEEQVETITNDLTKIFGKILLLFLNQEELNRYINFINDKKKLDTVLKKKINGVFFIISTILLHMNTLIIMDKNENLLKQSKSFVSIYLTLVMYILIIAKGYGEHWLKSGNKIMFLALSEILEKKTSGIDDEVEREITIVNDILVVFDDVFGNPIKNKYVKVFIAKSLYESSKIFYDLFKTITLN